MKWPIVPLGEFMVTRSGTVTPAKFPDERFDLFSIPAHDAGGFSEVLGSEVGSAKQPVQPGDVRISKIVPHIRRARVVSKNRGNRQIASGEWIVFRGAAIDSNYLRNFLTSDQFHRQFLSTVAGVGGSLVRARPAYVRSIGVPLPPLEEQRRIATILDKADALRAQRQRASRLLDQAEVAVFQSMFARASFPMVSAGDVMPTMRNGLSPSRAGRHAANVLTLSAVTQGRFDPNAAKSGTFKNEPPTEQRVSAADFLMCRGNGNLKLVGVGTFAAEDRYDLVFPDTVIAGRVDQTKVLLPFLTAVWKQQTTRNQIEAVARTTNGTYKVNQQTLAGITLPLPPLPLQKEFAERVRAIANKQEIADASADSLDTLFASLQSRAFAGEL